MSRRAATNAVDSLLSTREGRSNITTTRHHKTIPLGLKSEKKKWEAERDLRAFIERQSGTCQARPSGDVTLRWFWSERFRPMKKPKWKPSSRNELVKNIERYVVAPLGDRTLVSLDKFTLQNHVNELARKYSKSVVEKALIWSRAILEEALDQDYIGKNPGKKLEMPETRKVNRKTVDPARIAKAFATLPIRERLMLRIALILGLWMPIEIKAELDFWRSVCEDAKPNSGARQI